MHARVQADLTKKCCKKSDSINELANAYKWQYDLLVRWDNPLLVSRF